MTADQLRNYVDLATGWELFPRNNSVVMEEMDWEEYEEYKVWRERCLNRAAELYPDAYHEAMNLRPIEEPVTKSDDCFDDEIPF